MDGVRVNVANKGGPFGAEFFQTRREVAEETLGFLGVLSQQQQRARQEQGLTR